MKLRALKCILFVLLVCPAAVAGEDLRTAKSLCLSGQYHRAVALSDKLATAQPHQGELAALRLDLAALLGRWGQAENIYNGLEERVRRSRPVLFSYAGFLMRLGRYAQAEVCVKAILQQDRDNIRALAMQGRILWFAGKRDQSVNALKKIKDRLNAPVLAQDRYTAPELVEAGMALGLYSQIAPEPRLADFALNDVIAAAVKKASGDPAGPIASARLLASRYNDKEAAGDFHRALKLAPEHPDALAGLARLDMDRFRFKAAREGARKALITNPGHPEAHLVLADHELVGAEVEGALKEINLALAVNPHLTGARGRKAACLEMLGRADEAEGVRKEVRHAPSLQARALVAEGQVYLNQRRFGLATAAFESAQAIAPVFAEASRMLGRCQMLAGEEKKAYVNLESAHEIDPYNRKTYNLLEVLDWMDSHFVERRLDNLRLKVAESDNEVLGALVVRECAEVFGDLKNLYGMDPGGVFVEIFPDHRTFSMRTAGQTWIATVGACTGPVVALFSARNAKGQRFNWRRVLRHEMTHAVTVMGTGYRVPVWFTEGCAVFEESRRKRLRPTQWMEGLARRLRRGRLIPVERLSSAFVRPESAEQRQLGYFQSALAIEFMTDQKGFEAVIGALTDFARGADTREMLKRRLGMTPEQFDAQMERYARSVLGDTVCLGGFDQEDCRRAEAAMHRSPDSLEAACRFAVAVAGFSRAGSPSPEWLVQGIKAGQQAMGDVSTQKDAERALGWLYLKAGRLAEAERRFDRLWRASGDPEACVGLARVVASRGANKRALELLWMLQKRFRLEPAILLWASQTASKAGLVAESMEWLGAYLETGVDDGSAALRYGRYGLKSERPGDAVEWFGLALSLDPFSMDAYIGLGESYLAVGDAQQAVFYLEIAHRLDPDDPTVSGLLARAYALNHQGADAARMAREAMDSGGDPELFKRYLLKREDNK